MKKVLNLIDPAKSGIRYIIHQFPDGEKHFEFLEDLDSLRKIVIRCRIKSADDIFILNQITDILEFHDDISIDYHIYYLMSMRMDRAMNSNRAYSLRVVTSMLILRSGMNDNIYVYEPHSDITHELLEYNHHNVHPLLLPWRSQFNIPKDAIICFPDEGAKNRYGNLFPEHNKIYGVKTRNDKGVIDGYRITFDSLDMSNSISEIIVIDDLCDGGGTFVHLANTLTDYYPDIKRTLCVTHMIQQTAIQKLITMYDQLVFTNSFKDWGEYHKCKVIDIIK